MRAVTKYRNELNTVPMRRWTAEEQDFFFSVITKVRNQGTNLVQFKKDDLKLLANYTDRNNTRFLNTLQSLEDKVFSMRYREFDTNSRVTMTLFQRFEIYWSDDFSEIILKVKVSDDFEYILNQIDAEFTQFELKQFTNIRSTYAKEMFKKLKQWRTIGKIEYPVDEFRDMLQVPKSYRATDINQVVLKPIREELKEYFKNLKVKPIKSNKRGNPVIAYEFTFEPERVGAWIENKYEQTDNEEPKLPFKNWLKENDI